eukprot:7193266-Heterocapsa_arctica.AAC.1
MWVRESFLKKIEGGWGKHEWVDVILGRAAVLRCWGPEGKLQVGMVYLQTGNSGGQAERVATMRKLVAELGKGGKALNIVTGDFNYVVDKMDR